MTQNILRLPEVIDITGLSRSSIYAMMGADKFPKKISLGDRAVGWLENEISEWIDEKAKMRAGSNEQA